MARCHVQTAGSHARVYVTKRAGRGRGAAGQRDLRLCSRLRDKWPGAPWGGMGPWGEMGRLSPGWQCALASF